MPSLEKDPAHEAAVAEKFIRAAESGAIQDIGRPEHVIEGILSKVFVRDDMAFKVYKHAKTYYGDLVSIGSRRQFYTDDFAWNLCTSPGIYKRLVGVKEGGGRYRETDLADAEDFYIEMQRYDDSQLLTHKLSNGTASTQDIQRATECCADAHSKLIQNLESRYSPTIARGWHDLFLSDIDDLHTLMQQAENFIERSFRDSTHEILADATNRSRYFAGFPESELVLGVDSHTDNILILGDAPLIVDSMMPKENWRVVDPMHDFARLATNVEVIGTKELAAEVYATYRNVRDVEMPLIPRLLYESRNGLIQWARRHLRGEHDLALRFRDYSLLKLEELKATANE